MEPKSEMKCGWGCYGNRPIGCVFITGSGFGNKRRGFMCEEGFAVFIIIISVAIKAGDKTIMGNFSFKITLRYPTIHLSSTVGEKNYRIVGEKIVPQLSDWKLNRSVHRSSKKPWK
ncbi:hypothetical protein CDAR_539011 [Caerostris darwini]|uniref:Uncharacterized protein n=1 Tax=Caerostris darwini TaxID=1538125 RepID=A0AAV4T460_9ARAC|nr:hypothetical protein CDAR_539011 [Caerostris darwini]